MMDDLEFRRQAYINPRSRNKDFMAYKSKCRDNQNFVDDLNRLDTELKYAMDVPVPDDLAARIQLNQTYNQYTSQHKQRKYWSLVASVALFIGLLFAYNLVFVQAPNKALGERVLSHVYHELDHLHEHKQQSLLQVNALLLDFGLSLDKMFGTVNYLGSCTIADTAGIHMVLTGETGPVTVLMLPGKNITDEYIFNDSRFNGLIMPIENGSVAVIGEKGESLKSLKQKLSQYLSLI